MMGDPNSYGPWWGLREWCHHRWHGDLVWQKPTPRTHEFPIHPGLALAAFWLLWQTWEQSWVQHLQNLECTVQHMHWRIQLTGQNQLRHRGMCDRDGSYQGNIYLAWSCLCQTPTTQCFCGLVAGVWEVSVRTCTCDICTSGVAGPASEFGITPSLSTRRMLKDGSFAGLHLILIQPATKSDVHAAF